MKSKVSTSLMLPVSFLIVSIPMFAHHGAAAYDVTNLVTIKGIVTDFQFRNPHVIVNVTVKDDKGTVQEWQGYFTSPNHLIRAGWTKDTIKVGDQITLTGAAARSGAASMVIRKVILANGQEPGLGPD